MPSERFTVGYNDGWADAMKAIRNAPIDANEVIPSIYALMVFAAACGALMGWLAHMVIMP